MYALLKISPFLAYASFPIKFNPTYVSHTYRIFRKTWLWKKNNRKVFNIYFSVRNKMYCFLHLEISFLWLIWFLYFVLTKSNITKKYNVNIFHCWNKTCLSTFVYIVIFRKAQIERPVYCKIHDAIQTTRKTYPTEGFFSYVYLQSFISLKRYNSKTKCVMSVTSPLQNVQIEYREGWLYPKMEGGSREGRYPEWIIA